MKGNSTIIAVVAVVVIIVAAVGVYFALGGDEGGSDTTETGDKYWIYLDGMDEINGWYSANGDSGEAALKSVLDGNEIDYNIENGWIKSINGYTPDVNVENYAVYVYSADLSVDPYAGYFAPGPSINQVNGNIVYIALTAYTYDPDTQVTKYDLNPLTTKNSDLMSTGPFSKDSGYKPLQYSDTYHFYIDGMEGINGWYTATGSDSEVALKNALGNAGIDCVIDDGWIKQIGSFVPDGITQAFATYTYTATSDAIPYWGYFFSGPAVGHTIGNIVYISLTAYTYDYDTSETTYDLNPGTSKDSNLMSSGPFATA